MKISRLIYLLIAISLHCFAAESTEENAKAMPFPSDLNDWQEQREFFQENGYLWIKNFFSHQQTVLLKKWTDDVNVSAQYILKLMQNSCSEYQPQNIPGSLIVVPEARDPLQVCRAEDILSCYPDLHHFIAGTVTAYIGYLLSEPYVLFKDKINFKWPGGGAFLPHQDFPAYEFLGPRAHVTAMVTIDPATLENGCLHVAKEWRKSFADCPEINQEQLADGKATLPYIIGGKEHGSIQPQYCEKMIWLALETSPDDLVLINSFIPHYSEPNNSNKPRRAMFITHNKLREGDHRRAYYHAKREDPNNPMFHIGTPTKARTK